MITTKNYNEIVNFLYEDKTVISKFIISYYQEYLSSIKSKTSLEKIDSILLEYVKKEDFYKYIQASFNINRTYQLFDSYNKVIKKIFKLYDIYENEKYQQIENTRWL